MVMVLSAQLAEGGGWGGGRDAYSPSLTISTLPLNLSRPLRSLARISYLYSVYTVLSHIAPLPLLPDLADIKESLPKITVAIERSPEIEPFLRNVNYI